MTQSELNNLKLCLTCGTSSFGSKLIKKLSIGKCTEKIVEDAFIATSLIEVMCRYTANCITDSAYRITMEDIDPTTILQVEVAMYIGETLIAYYEGDSGTDNILGGFEAYINTNTETNGWKASLESGVLTIWNCGYVNTEREPLYINEEVQSPIITETFTSEISQLTGYEDTSVDVNNTLTEDEICGIINKIKKLL